MEELVRTGTVPFTPSRQSADGANLIHHPRFGIQPAHLVRGRVDQRGEGPAPLGLRPSQDRYVQPDLGSLEARERPFQTVRAQTAHAINDV